MKSESLTDEEFDRLGTALARHPEIGAMNLEEIDGFFAALICAPDFVLPSEYLPEILGGDSSLLPQPELEELISLLARHWNSICQTLQSDDVFLPLLLEDEHGATHANDWAKGFMRGMQLRWGDWTLLVDDDEHGGSLVPIFALAHEHHHDPEMRPYKEPVSDEQREKLIVGLASGVMAIYDYFEADRLERARKNAGMTTVHRSAPKVGRNEPCPCGSGKKFKQCCGKVTLQ